MNLFIGEIINNNQAILPPEESHHLTRVLRLKVGDAVLFTNGKGLLYKAEVALNHSKKSTLLLLEKLPNTQQRNYKLHLAVAPTKQIDRVEWLVEKSVEIGMDEVSFLETFHSERRRIKQERLHKIAVAAMKQSLKAELPKVNDLMLFKDFITQFPDFEGQKFIAHCYSELEQFPIEKCIKKQQNYLFLIGPEGDFSKEEVALAMEFGFTPISLGEQRLRAETAALDCVFIANWVNK